MNNLDEHEDVETVSIPFNENNILIKNEDVEKLFKKFNIDIKVKDIGLYRKALTHKSYIKREYYGLYKDMLEEAYKLYPKGTLPLQDASNERFEFLGDTVIKLICADYLFDRFNEDGDDEGFLSRLKMKIENKLAKISDSFTVNMYDNGFMFEVSGRDHDGDWVSAKILCNTLEDLVPLIKEAAAMERD